MSWALSFAVALLFIIVSSPVLYKFTNQIFGPLGLRTSDATGKASNLGVVVHSIVFALLLTFTMKHIK